MPAASCLCLHLNVPISLNKRTILVNFEQFLFLLLLHKAQRI
jgi:hypothetical protein